MPKVSLNHPILNKLSSLPSPKKQMYPVDTKKIGSTISNNVELSGRSSAHVNIYDVIHAIEECTYPAADPSASIVTSSNGAQSNNNGAASSLDSGGWEGLASFLFGPDWHLIPLEGEDPLEVTPKLHQSQNNSSNVTSAAQAK